MKHIVFVLFTISLVLFSCKEKERKVTADLINFPETASGTNDQDLPEITFDSIEYDFDTIAIGEKVVHKYNFKNTGEAPLLIADVKPSCGCTTLKDWPKEPIMPGESGTIGVEFNSEGYPGAITKTIMVHTNARPKDVYLKLVGNVKGMDSQKEVKSPIEMERTR
ncbi:MAG: DUF1573 domain-containing protein [Flavobacteriales bacterium]|jgi:hypothetical protein